MEVLGEGKTLEEAIDNGLAKMQAQRENVTVEVLEEPSISFFGRKSGRAVVRLRLKQTNKEREQASLSGVVSGPAW